MSSFYHVPNQLILILYSNLFTEDLYEFPTDMMTNFSSQIEQLHPPPKLNSCITNTESSIQGLIKLCRRRKSYQQKTFKSSTNNDLSNDVVPWRLHLVNILESPQAHIVVIILLIFDLVIAFIELSSSLTPTKCKDVQGRRLQTWFHWVGVVILGLLFLKTILLCVGLGRAFFEKLGYVVDGVVVVVALVLELALARVGGGLLVVVSLWRVVRAVESVFELSDDAIQAKVEEVISVFVVLREENKRLLDTIAEEEKIILQLQEQLGGLYTQMLTTSNF